MKAKPRVKICCIASLEEAQAAISAGASALGLVSAMPSGPGVIEEDVIAEIARRVPPPIGTFLLTSETSAEAIIAQQRRCGTNTLQLCDYVDASVYRELRRELPGIALVQVIHVTGPESIEVARAAAEHVHALLLDSGDTTLPVKLLGGTGRVHDWTVSRKIRESVKVPLFLAGGLKADNVAEAVAAVEPFGLDLCSSVRTQGQLDVIKLEIFFAALAS
ncbi:phosphoribosylanthranilate isomerase [Luteolibacter soli]|uniref:N-(5'-phosphoribosyl)anthranilate isomerase n=1 Tax=Luteolibacter soli TaxID=3135280 RepID=A0ABU9AUD8_9BACT